MKYLASFSLLFVTYSLTILAQPTIQWQKSLGGSGHDEASAIVLTSDGGCVVAGYNASNDGDVSGNHGGRDFWVVKLDGTGVIQWQKSLGGSGDDVAFSIQSTTDNGYIVAGRSDSNDGEVSGNHGSWDFWIVKLNFDGILQWQKSLGGSETDIAYSIQTTNDGGYIVAGLSESDDGDVSGNHFTADFWVVKLDSNAVLQWQKSLGGFSVDIAFDIKPLSDGGYIVAGRSLSNEGDVSGNHGADDFWVVKLDESGAIQWQKSLGGSYNEEAFSIALTADDGYVVTGYSNSVDYDVLGNHGIDDCWIVKLDSLGTLQWQKSLGGSENEAARNILPTNDGGYLMTGYSFSNDGDLTNNQGEDDYWLVKTDSFGVIQWQKSLGGSTYDAARATLPTSNGGYLIAGYSFSNNGDVSGNHGGADWWIVKLNPIVGINEQQKELEWQLFPNPATDFVEIQIMDNERVTSALVTDVLGRKLMERYSPNSNHLDLSLLPSGIYTITILVQSGQTAHKKIIKQ